MTLRGLRELTFTARSGCIYVYIEKRLFNSNQVHAQGRSSISWTCFSQCL